VNVITNNVCNIVGRSVDTNMLTGRNLDLYSKYFLKLLNKIFPTVAAAPPPPPPPPPVVAAAAETAEVTTVAPAQCNPKPIIAALLAVQIGKLVI